MNRKFAFCFCGRCGMGARHFETHTEARKALSKHAQGCKLKRR